MTDQKSQETDHIGKVSALLDYPRHKLGLRGKSAIYLGLVILFALSILGGTAYWQGLRLVKENTRKFLQEIITEETRRLESFIASSREDLMIIAEIPSLQGIIRAEDAGGIDPVTGNNIEHWYSQMEQILIVAMKTRPGYSQIRYLDEKGNERVRVESDGKTVQVVPRNALQNKVRYAYFRETIKLKPGQVYYSELNLNREHGRIEVPHKPVFRIATPVYDSKNRIRGIIVINILGRYLLQKMEQGKDDATIYVINQEGYFIKHPDSSKEFGFDLGFKYTINDVQPELLDDIKTKDASTKYLKDKRSLVGFGKVYFDPQDKTRYWAIVHHQIPAGIVFKDIKAARKTIVVVGLSIIVFFAVSVTWFVSKSLVLPILKLSEAAEKMTKGDLSVRVNEGRVKDEFQFLYRTINAFAESQQHAREILEKEVVARTNDLAALNTFLEGLLDSAPDAIVSMRAGDRAITLFSKGAEKMFGYRAEEVLGKNVNILMPEPYRSQHDTCVGNYLESSRQKVIGLIRPVKAMRKSGEIFDVDLSVGECVTLEGISFHAVIRDISDRLKVEREREKLLKELEVRACQQTVVSELGLLALAGTDISKLMDEAVTRVAQTLDVEYCKVLELLPGGDALLLRAGVGWKEGYVGHTTVGMGADSQAGYTLLVMGQPVIVEDLRTERRFTSPPLLKEHGVVSGMTVIIHGQNRPFGVLGVDTTRRRVFTEDDINFLQAIANMLATAFERTQAEMQLQQLNDELERANRLKSEFLANMSHELRTPLNAIIGFSEVLKDGLAGELTREQKDYCTDIFTSGQHLLSLINDILDLSKVEAGKMTLNLEEVNIPALLENSLSVVKERALAHDIELDLKVEGVEQACIDERKFKQIVYNLLSNAVKFTPDGGRVGIICRPEDGNIYLEIWDTGIGISEKDMKKLFRPFNQLDSSLTKKYEGTGLGLAMVKCLVEVHAGHVEVKSEVGKGSRFMVRLPYRR